MTPTDPLQAARECGALIVKSWDGNEVNVVRFNATQLAAFVSRVSVPDGWISVDERLPEIGQSVALININRWENTAGDLEMNVRACGYLSAWGGLPSHWSIRGERATTLESFTHWLALPPSPAAKD